MVIERCIKKTFRGRVEIEASTSECSLQTARCNAVHDNVTHVHACRMLTGPNCWQERLPCGRSRQAIYDISWMLNTRHTNERSCGEEVESTMRCCVFSGSALG